MASALGKYGIRVNAINPGNTLTERLQEAIRLDALEQGITEAEALKRMEARIPLGRMARLRKWRLSRCSWHRIRRATSPEP